MRGDSRWWWLVSIPLLLALVLLLRPQLAGRVLSLALMAYGFGGLWISRQPGFGLFDPIWYGLAPVRDQPRELPLVIPEAWAFLLVGGWLAWRDLTSRPVAARLVLGRMAAPDRRGQQWGLLLLPVALAAGWLAGFDAYLLFSSVAWFAVTITLLTWSMLLIRTAPGLAARLATAGLAALGLVGLVVAVRWQNGLLLGPGRLLLAGPVGTDARGAVALCGLALLGLGCWLVPRTFPEVRSLLGLAPDAELTRRVQRLTESRAVAVDTAANDLRRLERDLHDGAQARLVALGMNLRAAEKLIHTSPDAAAALVAEARETSARALTELRELVRGVHPPVLADRGLTDAVRALALDSPLNVTTDVDLPGRVPAPVETACYFSIAELLTNAAKHSGGRDARIAIAHDAGMLRVEVTDFGLGGADPARGTGLAGIERRLAAFDGILAISSPAGGPTIAVMEVPCALSSPKISSC